MAALLMVVFFLNRPTIENAALDMELNSSDKKLIDDPNSIVADVDQT